jgi:hypothetical protein
MLAGLGASACGHDRWPIAAASDGIAIALYARPGAERYALVDDRRWIDVAGNTLVLDRIDPAAALPSLVIEPLAGADLSIGACARERTVPPSGPPTTVEVDPRGAESEPVAPILRCAVHARPGRYLVRLLYVTTALGYRAQHDVAVTAPDRATVASRFAIVTPAWRTRAEVALFDGAPGSEPPPRELARGTIALDGGVAVLAMPPREVSARLRRIYEGAMHRDDGPDPRDPRWGRDSGPAVWVWLELGPGEPGERAATRLAPGPVRVHLELAGDAIRDIDVPAAGRRDVASQIGLPLWIDDQLRGKRDRWTEPLDDSQLSERFLVSIGNGGDAAREVWIEELLRPATRRTISHAWPRSPEVEHRRLRMKLIVAPGAVERAGFSIDYER